MTLRDDTQLELDDLSAKDGQIKTVPPSVLSATPLQAMLNNSVMNDEQPTLQKIVNSAADLPTPIGGFIQLADYTNYLIGGNTTFADDLIGGIGSSITGLSVFGSPTLTYTGAGNFITTTGTTLQMDNLAVRCPNAAKIFEMVGGILLMNDVQFVVGASCAIGTFDDVLFNLATDCGFIGYGQGLTISNTSDQVFNWKTTALRTEDVTSTSIDLGTATFNTFIMNDVRIVAPIGAVDLAGLAGNGNIIADSIASVRDCSWLGGATALSGVTPDDFRWNFQGNNAVPDTMPDALLSLSGNATETIIAASNTPVKVAGVWVCERSSHFTCDTTGRATYIGERQLTTPIDVVASVKSAAGTPDATLYVAVNGVEVARTGQVSALTSSKAFSMSTIWQKALVNGDYIEVFIANNDGTQNLVVIDALLRIR
jgi:hypothetical protein